MSIYIKGMEMPETCRDCRLSTVIAFDKRPLCDALVQYMSYGEWEAKRLDNCPLVPVSPHGRLIDASESIRVEFYDEEHEDWTRHDMTIDDLLGQSWVDADAPTIIEAEESET